LAEKTLVDEVSSAKSVNVFYQQSFVLYGMFLVLLVEAQLLNTWFIASTCLYRLGRDCGFKEDNEIAVAVKYLKEKGQ